MDSSSGCACTSSSLRPPGGVMPQRVTAEC